MAATKLTRYDWERQVIQAWSDETCPSCGRTHPATDLDDDGSVWAYCWFYDKLVWLGREHVPTEFAPELEEDEGLPF